MRRSRLSTLMLLIVIVALSVALVVQHQRAARREAELQARMAKSWWLFLMKQQEEEINMLSQVFNQDKAFIEKRRSEAEALRQPDGGTPTVGRRSDGRLEGDRE